MFMHKLAEPASEKCSNSSLLKQWPSFKIIGTFRSEFTLVFRTGNIAIDYTVKYKRLNLITIK